MFKAMNASLESMARVDNVLRPLASTKTIGDSVNIILVLKLGVISMTIAERQRQLVARLAALKSSQDRLAYLVKCGRQHPALDPACKTDAFRVDGCLAKVWFVAESIEGRCYFKTDSDSAIVKGIAAVLCDFYSGHTPEEIASTDPSFLEKFGINQHLTPNRRNSLAKIWGRIQAFAAGTACAK
jgi:cysteine desulfuration protein SufE